VREFDTMKKNGRANWFLITSSPPKALSYDVLQILILSGDVIAEVFDIGYIQVVFARQILPTNRR
jgi:hypothetical protein